ETGGSDQRGGAVVVCPPLIRPSSDEPAARDRGLPTSPIRPILGSRRVGPRSAVSRAGSLLGGSPDRRRRAPHLPVPRHPASPNKEFSCVRSLRSQPTSPAPGTSSTP